MNKLSADNFLRVNAFSYFRCVSVVMRNAVVT